MVRTGRRFRQRGSLISQIIVDGVTSIGIGTTQAKFTEMDHRSSDIVLKKCVLDFSVACTGTSTIGLARCNVVSKPISEGIPVAADLDDERYSVHQCAVLVKADANGVQELPGDYHVSHPMKILVPRDHDVYVVVEAINAAIQFFYVIRLFWALI